MDERSWYAAVSGLTPPEAYSLADHQMAYWIAGLGANAPEGYSAVKRAFMAQATGLDPSLGIGRIEHDYWAALSGLTPSDAYSLQDHKAIAMGNPAPPVGGITNLVKYLPTSDNVSQFASSPGVGGASIRSSQTIPLFSQCAIRMAWLTAPTSVSVSSTYLTTSATNASGPDVSPGNTYTASIWVMSSFAAVVVCAIPWRGANDAFISTDYGSYTTLVPGVWTRLTATATAPDGAVTGGIRLSIGSTSPLPAVGDWIQMAGLMFTEGDTLYDYADGNTPGWVWNGTPGSSTSRGPDYTLESVAGNPDGYLNTPTSAVLHGFGALQGRTLYVVVSFSAVPTSYVAAGVLGTSLGVGRITVQSAGTGDLGYRIDLNGGSSNASAHFSSSAVTPPSTIAVGVSVNDGMTSASGEAFGKSTSSLSTSPGSGMETDPSLILVGSNSFMKPLAAAAYKGSHSDATRAAVEAWLANHYGAAG